MNKDRRNSIAKAYVDFQAAMVKLSELKFLFEDVKEAIENARDDEQEYFDNMPEALQGGDKGQAAEQTVSNLDDLVNSLDEFLENLEEPDLDFEGYEG